MTGRHFERYPGPQPRCFSYRLGQQEAAYLVNGDFHSVAHAQSLAGLLGLSARHRYIEVPETVEVLARVWPKQKDEQAVILAALTEQKVFGDPATALGYFLDVLVWNDESAVRSQPRAAFLRLYGAAESVIFFAFEAFVGRDPRVLKLTYEDSAALERLTAMFPTDRAQLVPQVDLARLLGEGAEAGRKRIPRIRGHVEPPPLSRGLYNRLIHSKKGGLGRFSRLRNKVAHWMAPVPTESVLELRQYYLRAVGELVPRALDQLTGSESRCDRERLKEWVDRLLAAVRGRVDGKCKPVSYRQALGSETDAMISRPID